MTRLLRDEEVCGSMVTPVVVETNDAQACPKCMFQSRATTCESINCLRSEREDGHRVYFLKPMDAMKARLRGTL